MTISKKKSRRNMFHFGSAFIALAGFFLLSAVTIVAEENSEIAFYEQYNRVLHNYVDTEGLVRYKALKENRQNLDTFVKQMATLSPQEFDTWSEQRKIAFWNNAYNALTLKAIIDHYPIQSSFVGSFTYPKNSIRQIPGVWKKLEHTVMGQKMTLDHIEHGILRKEFKEPRIHVALVCAAISCPPLRNEAFVTDSLDDQLKDQTKKFLARQSNFRVDMNKKAVFVSAIFDWFKDDFVTIYGDGKEIPGLNAAESAVIFFISTYHPQHKDFLLAGNYSLSFSEYDWTLNEKNE